MVGKVIQSAVSLNMCKLIVGLKCNGLASVYLHIKVTKLTVMNTALVEICNGIIFNFYMGLPRKEYDAIVIILCIACRHYVVKGPEDTPYYGKCATSSK